MILKFVTELDQHLRPYHSKITCTSITLIIHLVIYNQIVITPQPGIIWQSPKHLTFEIFPPLTENALREWVISYLY